MSGRGLSTGIEIEAATESQVRQLLGALAKWLSLPGDDQLLLRLRLALSAPRFETSTWRPDGGPLADEGRQILARIRRDQGPFAAWRCAEPSELTSLTLEEVEPSTANAINTRFHYIGTERTGYHLGLFNRGSRNAPLTSLTFSELDLPHVRRLLDDVLPGGSAIVLSRAYSFRSAPKNAFSYALARAVPRLQAIWRELDLIVSYVNPNVGFTGSSYRASGWEQIAEEVGTTYFYANGSYVTRRELLRRYGSTDLTELSKITRQDIEVSRVPLMPLKLFALPTSTRAAEALARAEIIQLDNLS